jgi:serine/threonine protein kinase
MPLPAGTLIGRYELLEPAAAGRLSEVYKARDTSIGRTVAVKLLAASLADDPAWLKRFEQEARAAGQLDHPNVVSIHDVGIHERRPYLVSEWLEGETLRQRLATADTPWRKAVAYALQIAHGIAAAHDKGIIHRDLKPENVFLTRDGRIKILDLGLAKTSPAPMIDSADAAPPTAATITQPGAVLGTVGYMSPEQVRGQRADARSDIFSFGAILYEMLAGRRAFLGESAIETLVAILREDPPPIPSSAYAPAALEAITRRCVEKNPEERFQSARDVAFALEELLKIPDKGSGRSSSGSRPSTRTTRPLSRVTKDSESARKRPRDDDSGFRLIYRDKELILAPGENIVGRGRGATIQLSSKSISRRHARIVVQDDQATLEDLQSKNGTFLRGERIEAPTRLADGDAIRMGSSSMTLRARRETDTTETGGKSSGR